MRRIFDSRQRSEEEAARSLIVTRVEENPSKGEALRLVYCDCPPARKGCCTVKALFIRVRQGGKLNARARTRA